ncbi:transglutaminase-like domain-containing protein [Autumnicola psychrophila]|uniref:Transglutaminase family protein n=1 Tax=Autumnicola psychrophila TaxID=3075592 RepID=A0ABU3DVL1_9FLAO|nr:transglutaminase family protein [Zunongwangia sp. F225]MDT0687773.1 transglutaminase family protein [Zunongwangia sp. F225]
MEYTIKYKAQNTYEASTNGALWQFLITPEDNDNQTLEFADFKNSLQVMVDNSINGYGFKTYRIQPKQVFKEIEFEAEFKLIKEIINPFEAISSTNTEEAYQLLDTLDFKVEHEQFLRKTALTSIPANLENDFNFDTSLSIFENLQRLNTWIYDNFKFKADITDVDSDLTAVLQNGKGVCQDFTHLFCALGRRNKIPTRYVSGYLHQGQGYEGDSQMHAWAESYIPGSGWMGFDPTNNLIAVENHIKVAHGKDYSDCPPIKGLVYTTGANETSYTVEVFSQQEQQQQQ